MNNETLHQILSEHFDAADIALNEPMAKHTTFKVGGPADVLVYPHCAEDIVYAIRAAQTANVPWWIIGCGSDLLVSDEGLPGLVIEIGQRMAEISVEGTTLRAQAGATNEAVAKAACAAGLAGYEFASGIPGSIGGAAIMNAGAYDGEFKDVAKMVWCLDLRSANAAANSAAPSESTSTPTSSTPTAQSGEQNSASPYLRKVSAQEADWGYRHSMMGDEGLVVLAVELELRADDRATIQARMDDLAQRRASKQPLEMASAGSTFKRPTGYFAGKLIQDSGMQGHTVGGAQVSTKHAGFVVNTGTATAADVRQVIQDVQRAVKEQFGVDLETEVKMWGFHSPASIDSDN